MRHLSERCALVPVKTVPNYFTCLCTCHAIFCDLMEWVFIKLKLKNTHRNIARIPILKCMHYNVDYG